jgi:hypothetical protein
MHPVYGMFDFQAGGISCQLQRFAMNFNPVSEADSNAVATLDDLFDENLVQWRNSSSCVESVYHVRECSKFRNMLTDEQLLLVR